MNKKLLASLSISALIIGAGIALTSKKPVETQAVTNYVVSTNGCSQGTVPNTVYLDSVDAADIRSYYASLNSLITSERQGTNLLKNLKPILYEMNYFKYGGWSNNGVTTIYSITDRDWTNSPASSISSGTYNQANNTITNFNHMNELHADPYIHMLYIDYNISGPTRAEDSSNPGNPSFDKEHVWCQSRGFKGKSETATGPAGTDLHHLIAGEPQVNQTPHNNNPYGFVKNVTGTGNKNYTINNKKGSAVHTSANDESNVVFEPQDSDKGDIARAIFYMAARYNNFSGVDEITDFEPNLLVVNYATDAGSAVYSTSTTPVTMGILSDLLAWHKLDPVDEYEKHRNDLIYRNYQGNRNPFIDFPEWVDYIWGTADNDGGNYNSNPTGYANPSSDTVYGYNTGVAVDSVSFDKTSLSLDLFAKPSATLTATVLPNNATNKAVNWTSSNNNVATVVDGVVTAVGTGSATITVTTVSGGKTATCNVTVEDTTPVVTSVTLNKTSQELDLNRVDQVQLTATVNGENYPPSKVDWESSDEDVATVTSSGLVTAVATGNAIITATSNYDNTKSASCEITVIDSSILTDNIVYSSIGFTDKDSGYTTKTGITVSSTATYSVHSYKNSSNYIQFNTTSPAGLISTSSPGNLMNITVTFNTSTLTTGNGRTVKVYGSQTAYSGLSDLYDSEKRGTELGSNKYVVNYETVSFDIDPDDGYKYVGVKVEGGAAYFDSISITWKEDGSYVAPASVSLNYESRTIGMNEELVLSATVLPEETTNKSVTWTTSDDKVAIVNDNGVVTGISAGTATITADTNDQHLTASCIVTVTQNRKYRYGPFAEGVPYKMYLQTKGYFNGGIGDRDYFGATSANYSDGVDVYFETVNSKLRIYFMQDATKKYIVAYKNNTYDNFGIKDESVFTDGTTIFDWEIDSNGILYNVFDDVGSTHYALGIKSGQNFTTFAMNPKASINRFVIFEYTAESFASDFLTKITCDANGVNAPIYSESYTWNDFKAIYNSMNSDQKALLSGGTKSETGNTIQKALARYEYMVWKYHYEDFLNRDVPLSSNRLGFDIQKANNSAVIIIIATVSLVSIIGIGLFIYKKKER